MVVPGCDVGSMGISRVHGDEYDFSSEWFLDQNHAWA